MVGQQGGLQIPEEFMAGGLQAVHATHTGFSDPATGKSVAFAPEFGDSGFNVVAAATRAAGQDTQGFEAYKEIAESGQHSHQQTLEATQSIGSLKMETHHTIAVPAVAGVGKNNDIQIT